MSNSTSFLDLFNPPTLEELMSMYQYRSGAGLYDNLLRSEMEEFVANAADFQLDFTEALQDIEAAVQAGATSVQRTIVIPVDIETNVDIQIDYVLDINHTVNFTVNGTLTAEYGQEITVTAEDIDWSEDSITGFSKWAYVPGDGAQGENYRLALHDTGAIDSFFDEFGHKPTVDQLTEFTGEAPAISLNDNEGKKGPHTFDFGVEDVMDVRDGNAYGGLTATLFNEDDGLLDGYQHRILPPTLDNAMSDVFVADIVAAVQNV